MSIESVRRFMAQHAPDIDIIETDGVTATVEQAAIVHNVEPNQIAKTLSLKVKNEVVLVVCAGEARLDNQKVKQALGSKARMLRADEVVELTSHPVGVFVHLVCLPNSLYIAIFHCNNTVRYCLLLAL